MVHAETLSFGTKRKADQDHFNKLSLGHETSQFYRVSGRSCCRVAVGQISELCLNC